MTAVGFVGVVWRERGRRQRRGLGGGGGEGCTEDWLLLTLIYSVLAEERAVYFSGC